MYELLVRIMADAAVLPVVFVGAYALLFKIPKKGRFEAYCRILMAGLTAYLFAKLIGAVYQPELQRPFELLGQSAGASYLDNPGFPSDHVLFCTAITLAVWFETRSRKIAVLLAVLTLIVAAGRILALVHSPLDVVGGVVIACIGAVWYLQRQAAPAHKRVKQWSKPSKAGKLS